MEKLRTKLMALKEKESQIKKVVNRSFSSEEEFNLFVEENKDLFVELKNIKNEIRKIEWELLTNDEKEAHLQYLKGLKDKFKDEQ